MPSGRALAFERHVEERMRKALAAGEFAVYVQPQFFLDDGSLAGVEALCRWDSPDLGLSYARPVHPPVRTQRVHRRPRLLHARAGMQALSADGADEARGRPRPRGRQLLARHHAAERLRGTLRAPRRALRLPPCLPARRGHRERAHGGRPGARRHSERASASRVPHRHGRLRHRVLVAFAFAEHAHRRAQDRPQLPFRQRGRRAVAPRA